MNDRYVPDLSLFVYIFAIFAVNLLIEKYIAEEYWDSVLPVNLGLSLQLCFVEFRAGLGLCQQHILYIKKVEGERVKDLD